MTKYLSVPNWEKFQHYKDRNPPWIKLNTDTFTEYDFGCLQDASKLLAICIWTLASRYRDPKLGVVPADLEYIKKQCNLGNGVKLEHLQELVNKGFLIDASNALASCKQSASPETETETETYIDNTRAREDEKFEEFWSAYGKIGSKERSKQKFNKAIKEGVSYEEIIKGLERYQSQCRANKLEQKYVQHANTWLNNKGWQDDYPIYDKPEETLKESIRTYANQPQKLDPWELQGSQGADG